MMLSVMVVGAGAAFSDQSKIKNTEAVDACTALNIIGGYPDGSFKPEGNITRAEVTKMICVALNGGKNPAVSTNTTPTFSDVRNNTNAAWAEGYIESCAAQGIVSGVGGGKFAPNGNVTGVQLAKMLLVSLGYKSENEGFTGNAWATNVNVRAAQKGLYEGLEKMDTAAAITRDNAAQMVWNALQAYEVEYVTNLVADKDGKLTTQITVQDKIDITSKERITLMEDKYETESPTGVLATVSKESGKDSYMITIKNAVYNGKDYGTADKNGSYTVSYSKVPANYIDLLGQDVRVLVKPSKNGKDATVYGVYATSKNTVVTAVKDNVDDADKTNGKFAVDGVSYKTNSTTAKAEDTIKVYPTSDLTGTKAISSKNTTDGTVLKNIPDYAKVTFIDNDDDDKIDFGIYTPFTFAKVTYVSSDTVTLKAVGATKFVGDKASKSYNLKDDDVNLYKDAAKDDYVIVTESDYTADSYASIVKADVVSGKATSIKTGKLSNKEYTKEVSVDGTWYKIANAETNTDANKVEVNDEFDFYIANGFFFYADKTAGNVSANNIVFVDKAVAKTYGTDSGDVILANLYFSDGTSKKDVNVAKVNGTKIDKTDDDGTIASGMVTQRLFKYSTKSNGDYELTALSATEKGNYDAYVSGDNALKLKDGKFIEGVTNSDSASTSLRFADNAVIFVKDKDDVKVVTGKNVAAWKDHTDPSYFTALRGVADKTSGNYYMEIGAIVLKDDAKIPGGSSVKYGMLTSGLSKTTVDSTDYYNFEIWNGTETVKVKIEADSKYDSLDKKSFIAYTEVAKDANGVMEIEIDNEKTDIKTVSNAVSIESYDNASKTKTVKFRNDAKEYDLSDDAVIIGVNTEDKTGSTGATLDVGDETATSGVYYLNAVYFMDGEDVSAIFIDTTGAMYDSDKMTTTRHIQYDCSVSAGSSNIQVVFYDADKKDWLNADEIAALGLTKDQITAKVGGTVKALANGTNGDGLTWNGPFCIVGDDTTNESAKATLTAIRRNTKVSDTGFMKIHTESAFTQGDSLTLTIANKGALNFTAR